MSNKDMKIECNHEYFTNELEQKECKHCTLLKSTIDHIEDDPKMVDKPICDICQTEHKHKEIDEDKVKDLADKISEESWEKELRILMASFSMYLANDTGAENDKHEEEIAKFKSFIASLVAKAHAEGEKEMKEKFIKWMRFDNDITILHRDQWENFLVSLDWDKLKDDLGE